MDANEQMGRIARAAWCRGRRHNHRPAAKRMRPDDCFEMQLKATNARSMAFWRAMEMMTDDTRRAA